MTSPDPKEMLDVRPSMFDRDKYSELLQLAMGALADIALANDLTERGRRLKAKRIYDAISKAILETE